MWVVTASPSVWPTYVAWGRQAPRLQDLGSLGSFLFPLFWRGQTRFERHSSLTCGNRLFDQLSNEVASPLASGSGPVLDDSLKDLEKFKCETEFRIGDVPSYEFR
jgi:hypothetical protein